MKPKSSLSYGDFYIEHIAPVIEQIDLLLKRGDIIKPWEAAAALDLTLSETYLLMEQLSISCLDKHTFPLIMQNGSSPICALFARELRVGCPSEYTADQIAYIYGLDFDRVKAAFDSLGAIRVKGGRLMEVFQRIPISINL